MAKLKVVVIEGEVDGQTVRQILEQFLPGMELREPGGQPLRFATCAGPGDPPAASTDKAIAKAVAKAKPFNGAAPGDWHPAVKPHPAVLAAARAEPEFAMTEEEEREAEALAVASMAAVDHKLAPPPVATAKPPRKNAMVLECLEHPGRTFGSAEVLAMTGVKKSSAVASALCQAKARGKEWCEIGPLHFRRRAPASVPAADPHEARPRARSGDTLPVNHHVRGAAARVTPSEVAPNGSGRTYKRGEEGEGR